MDYETQVQIICDLKDGSRIVGVPALSVLPIDTMLGHLEVPLNQTTSLQFQTGSVSIKLRNGDQLTGKSSLESFMIDAAFGEVNIPIEAIKMIRLQSQVVGITESGVVAYYDFKGDFTPHVEDKSGNGYHLKVASQGAVHSRDMGSFSVAVFNAGTLEARSNPTANLNHMTVSLWFKSENLKNNYKLAAAAWWRGGTNASGWNIGTQYPEAWADDGLGSCRGGCTFKRQVDLIPGAWNQIAIAYDRHIFREFINGEVSYECPTEGYKIGWGDKLTVGNWMQGFPYNGLITEFIIYDRALDQLEMHDLYTRFRDVIDAGTAAGTD